MGARGDPVCATCSEAQSMMPRTQWDLRHVRSLLPLLGLHFALSLRDCLVLGLVLNFHLQRVFEDASHFLQESGNTVALSFNYLHLGGKPGVIISSGSCLG